MGRNLGEELPRPILLAGEKTPRLLVIDAPRGSLIVTELEMRPPPESGKKETANDRKIRELANKGTFAWVGRGGTLQSRPWKPDHVIVIDPETLKIVDQPKIRVRGPGDDARQTAISALATLGSPASRVQHGRKNTASKQC